MLKATQTHNTHNINKLIRRNSKDEIYVVEIPRGDRIHYYLKSATAFVSPENTIRKSYSLKLSAPIGHSFGALASQKQMRFQAQRICNNLRAMRGGHTEFLKLQDVTTLCMGLELEVASAPANSSVKKTVAACVKHLRGCYGGDVELSSICPNILQDFAEYLKASTLAVSSMKQYVSVLKSYLHKLRKYRIIDVEIIDPDPLGREAEVRRVWLTLDQVVALYNYRAESPAVDRIRRAAVLSCQTGLRYTDILNLTIADIIRETREGREKMVLDLIVNKTGRQIRIALTAMAQEIVQGELDREDRLPHNTLLFMLPKYNTVINQYVSVIMQGIGITQKVCFHDFRRTFAHICLQTKNIKVPQISAALGHTSIAATQRYLNMQGISDTDADQINDILETDNVLE